jgi:hypothetical protein
VGDGGVTPPTTLRARVGRLAQRLVPDLDERQWNRKRDREMRELLAAGGYSTRLADLPVSTVPAPRAPHLVIVPKEGSTYDTWRAAGGNFFFEISQAAREYYGDAKVSLFSPDPDESVPDWQARLIRYLVTSGATHLMAMVETDPDGAETWSWDVLWSQLSTRWDGVFLGVMFDSAYRWITIPTRRLARTSDRFVLVDIAMPMDGSLVKGRPEVGPVNMPVSNLSLALIDEHIGSLPKIHDVTFVGSLYPGRVAMIEELRAHGVRVAVNPHHASGEVLDLAGSRSNQPGYVGYMSALAQSHMTINFGRSSVGDVYQLKTRVLESASMGCIVLTDDVDRTDRFWVQGEEFGWFETPADVPALVRSFLDDPDRMRRVQEAGRAKARSINVSSFWGGVEQGLARRGLPLILSAPAG